MYLGVVADLENSLPKFDGFDRSQLYIADGRRRQPPVREKRDYPCSHTPRSLTKATLSLRHCIVLLNYSTKWTTPLTLIFETHQATQT